MSEQLNPLNTGVLTVWLRITLRALSTSAGFFMSTVYTSGSPMVSAYGCWEVTCENSADQWRRCSWFITCGRRSVAITSRMVGLSLKKSEFSAQWRVQPGVQENTAIGQGFQGGGAFVGKRQAHQNLKARGRRWAIRRREMVKERDYITQALWCNNHVCKI